MRDRPTESLELIAQRAADANPGARTIGEARESARKAFLAELRKLFNVTAEYDQQARAQ